MTHSTDLFFKKSNITQGFIALMFISMFFFSAHHAFAATITVNSNADTAVDTDGNCTLREALENATNGSELSGGDCVAGAAGSDTIVFSAPMTITLASAISGFATSQVQPVIIDGITGGHGNCVTKSLGVIIDGAGFAGLSIQGANSTVKGLVLKNFGDRPLVVSGDDSTVSCNIIGLSELGAVAGNTGGLLVSGANPTVGGSAEGDGNIISDNDDAGITIWGTGGAVIKGNIIGLNIAGTADAGNLDAGIEVFSSGTMTGVTIGGSGQYERNIISGNGAEGILVRSGTISDVTIQNNYIGTDILGTTAIPNITTGISVCGSCIADAVFTNITIGGATSGQGNVIAGNTGNGVLIDEVDGATIRGNYIGIDSSGTMALVNSGLMGMQITVSDNVTVGGATAASRNYITGPADSEAFIVSYSTGTATMSIIGNWIGLGTDGSLAGAIASGIVLSDDLSNVVVGGTGAGEGNVVAGATTGINIESGTGVSVFGNKIGTDTDGVVTVGYGNTYGIMMSITSADNQIGGINAGEGNTIAGNTSSAIVVAGYDDGVGGVGTPDNNTVLGNSIFSNGGIGIDLIDNILAVVLGHTANDSGDGDSGPNGYLNHPVLNDVTDSGANTLVQYTLDVPASAYPYRVEFFTNPTEGALVSGYGEGEVYEDYAHVSPSGSTTFTKTLTGVNEVDVITMTVTECLDADCTTFGSTSEFSNTTAVAIAAAASSGGGSSGGVVSVCKDVNALNYRAKGRHKQSLCVYPQSTSKIKTVASILGSGACPANLIVSDFMKRGDRNGKFSAYNKKTVTEIGLLQAHINRILAAQYSQAAGPVDGIFGPLTHQGVTRLQVALNEVIKPVPILKIDGIVGPFTRAAINNSCGGAVS